MRTNFMVTQQKQYSLTELENMVPWEREAYLTLVINWVQEENERIRQKNA